MGSQAKVAVGPLYWNERAPSVGVTASVGTPLSIASQERVTQKLKGSCPGVDCTSENDSDEIPVRVFLDRVSRYTDSS